MTIDPLNFVGDVVAGWLADPSLELLLSIMQGAIQISTKPYCPPRLKGYHENLQYGDKENPFYFSGKYLFDAKGGARSGAVFKSGEMERKPQGIDDWNVRVVFKNDRALVRYLLKGVDVGGVKVDAAEAMLKNEVQVFGNFNYLFKFGYMTKDLLDRARLLRC